MILENKVYSELTKSFVSKGKEPFKFRTEIDWFKMCRIYYLLLPEEALEDKWKNCHPIYRQKKIKEHLNGIAWAINSDENAQAIDSWAIERLKPRLGCTDTIAQIRKKFHGICYFCGQKNYENKQVDHIFPKSRGGSLMTDNLALICANCNGIKSNSLVGENFSYGFKNFENIDDFNNKPSMLKFYTFLRDSFSCQNDNCKKGIKNGSELYVSKILKSGIICFDNLKVICKSCYKNES